VKFLVDNQLPKELARWLVSQGQDAEHVLDRGQGQADDRQLWSDALAEDRIMISKDEDFFILAMRVDDFGKLLWLRVGNCRTAALIAAFEKSLPAIIEAFEGGQRIVEIR
jgi:predicted nuclease of predicted toxin-antitoxin system